MKRRTIGIGKRMIAIHALVKGGIPASRGENAGN
jgi:hypothetical protein